MKKQILLFFYLSFLCVSHSVTLAISTVPGFSILTTETVSSITATTAIAGGNITNQGGSPVLARGVCWSLNPDPTIADNVTSDGAGLGTFTSSITGLTSGLTYHVRAYATNDAGTAYGSDLTFTTLGTEPTVITTAASAITKTTATAGGEVTNAGTSSVTARGVCWSTLANPTVADAKTTDADGTGIFSSSITGLTSGVTYHVRAYATSEVGTSYGADLTFATLGTEPTVTTTAANAITKTTATAGGEVTSAGTSPVTARGVCWSTLANPTVADAKTTDADGTGIFSSSITGLTSGVTYHVRAYATSAVGTSYGADLTFTTLGTEPTVTTTAASSITKTTATAGGEVTSAGTSPVTARGVCWGLNANPTITDHVTTDADGIGVFTSNISGLTSAVTYHIRAYATSAVGTSYGADLTFTTLGTEPTVTTTVASSITKTTATAGGEVTSAGTSPVTARGICWGLNVNPSITDNVTTDADGVGVFTSNISSLTSAITYHIRAYATSAVGTSYGDDLTFTTLGTEPTVTTTAASSITKTTATAGGEVTSAGTSPVTARGVCWGLNANPSITDHVTTDADGTGIFSSSITGLTSGVTYHIRAYATNAVGTSYGADLTFETLGTLPTVTTTAASFVTSTTATAGGEVTNAGTSPVTARGVCWGLNANPILANANSTGIGLDKYISSITGLKPNTTYHIRAYATSAVGTSYGEDLTLTTIIADPTTTINVPTAGTLNTLIASGDITSITNLTLTGTIDARDVKYLRDQLVNLEALDISTVNINSYSGIDGTITTNTNYPANEMPTSSFSFMYGKTNNVLKSITLPNSITSIGSSAFGNCIGLTNIIIPNSVVSIGVASFYGCNSVNNLMLGTSVTTIADGAFNACIKLTSITIPASLSTIGSKSFTNSWGVKEFIVDSDNLNYSSVDGVLFNRDKTTLILFPKDVTTYTIPGTVTTIGSEAFQYNFGVNRVVIPASLTTIVDDAFGSCRGLTEFVVDPGNLNFSTLDGCLFNKNQSALIIYPAGKKGNYTIPNTVTSIRNYAFSGCTELTSVVIGSSVSSMQTGSFVGCWNLLSISSARAIPISLNNPYVFSAIANTNWTLYVPVGSKTAYQAANQWKDAPNIVEGFPAIVDTETASSITTTTVVAGGNVSSEGTSAVTARGVCWSSAGFPTIADNKTTEGTGLGAFTSSISNLSPGVTYHIRAYATTDLGTAYGSDMTFATLGIPPTVSTVEVGSITKTTAISGGNITSVGTSQVIARGVCWSTSANPTIADNKTTDGTGVGAFSSSMVGLASGVTYHYRAYATNNDGTSYGLDKTFSTLGTLPAVTTTAASFIGTTGATAGGNVTSEGSSSVTFRGICWGRTINPTTADNITTDGTGAGIFSTSITGLTPGVTYHFRAYATNSVGTVYGDDVVVVTTTTGLSDQKMNSITLYPNPVIDDLQIKDLDGTGSFTLSDLSGRQLINKKIMNNEVVSVAALPNGVYIVKITTKDRTIEKKVMKN
jgi:hypothetical protein